MPDPVEPLTDAEINADLEAMHIEFDPRDITAVRSAQRKRAMELRGTDSPCSVLRPSDTL